MKAADLAGTVTGFNAVGQYIDCICGKELIKIEKRSGDVVRKKLILKKEVPVSDSSMWSIVPYGPSLVCGTVDGRLLLLDKTSLSVERTLVLGKKNTGSLYLDGDTLYAASQDGTLFKIDLHRLRLSGRAYIEDDLLYISSRNIAGIDLVPLSV